MHLRPTFGIFLTLGLLLASCILLYFGLQDKDDPVNRVKAELELIQSGKLTEAYYTYTSKEFQAATSLEEFKTFVRSHEGFKNPAKVDYVHEEEDGKLKTVEVALEHEGEEPLTLSIRMIKEDDEWKILNIQTVQAREASLEVQEIVEKLEYFFKVLKNREPEMAYKELTSPSFKTNTSLDGFKDFIGNYPILLTFEHSELKDLSTTQDFAIAKLALSDSMQDAEIDFTLVKEKEEWLVNGMQVVSLEVKPGSAHAFNNEELSHPILQQLKKLKEGKLKDAYDIHTSKAFRQATSWEAFEKFVKENPILTNHKEADLQNLTFNNNIGIYTLLLKSPSGEKQLAEFSMIHEGDGWKVLQIKLFEMEK